MAGRGNSRFITALALNSRFLGLFPATWLNQRKEITLKNFAAELEQIVRKHAPLPTVHVGELVQTTWSGNKKPQIVRISKIWAQLVHRPQYPYRPGYDPEQPGIAIALCYIAERLRKDGTSKEHEGGGIVLQEFSSADGRTWSAGDDRSFNHCDLSWTIEAKSV